MPNDGRDRIAPDRDRSALDLPSNGEKVAMRALLLAFASLLLCPAQLALWSGVQRRRVVSDNHERGPSPFARISPGERAVADCQGLAATEIFGSGGWGFGTSSLASWNDQLSIVDRMLDRCPRAVLRLRGARLADDRSPRAGSAFSHAVFGRATGPSQSAPVAAIAVVVNLSLLDGFFQRNCST